MAMVSVRGEKIAITMENSLTYQLKGKNPLACPKGFTTTTINESVFLDDSGFQVV